MFAILLSGRLSYCPMKYVLFTDHSFVARGSCESRMNQTTRTVPAGKPTHRVAQSTPRCTPPLKAIVGKDRCYQHPREPKRKLTLSRNLRPQQATPWMESTPVKKMGSVAVGMNTFSVKAPGRGRCGSAVVYSGHRRTKSDGATVHTLQEPLNGSGGPFVADLFQLSFS